VTTGVSLGCITGGQRWASAHRIMLAFCTGKLQRAE